MSPHYIASIFGPLFALFGIWTILYRENIGKVVESFQKNPAVLFLGGAINLLIGLAIINVYSTWRLDLALLVTFLGWLFFLRGLIILFLPSLIYKIHKIHVEAFILCGLIFLVWGLALCWLAFG
jgi:uncharacterized membrane protein